VKLAPTRRDGMTLLEVLAAMAIFLFALVGLGQLLSICVDVALETQYTNRASQLCVSKMNDVICGAVSASSGGDGTFDEEPDWSWNVASDSGGAPNLYLVTVTVSRKRKDGTMFEAKLAQMVLDPATKGTIESPPADSGATGTTGMGS